MKQSDVIKSSTFNGGKIAGLVNLSAVVYIRVDVFSRILVERTENSGESFDLSIVITIEF